MKTQAIIYQTDHPVKDKNLLSYLGIDELTIKKGGYFIDYTKNPNGELKLQLGTQLASNSPSQNITFIGLDAKTNKHFEYTVTPQYVNGIADSLIITYQNPVTMRTHSHLLIQLYKLGTALLFLGRQLFR